MPLSAIFSRPHANSQKFKSESREAVLQAEAETESAGNVAASNGVADDGQAAIFTGTCWAGTRCVKGGFRQQNQDRCYANSNSGLFLVADGMGGHGGGSEASSALIDLLPAILEPALRQANRIRDMDNVLRSAFQSARNRMRSLARKSPEFLRMGCTMAMAMVSNGQLWLTHVGDCRIYRLRGGRLQRLTRDETLVQTMIDAQVLTEEQAKTNAYRHVVLNSVGVKRFEIHPRLTARTIQAGDRLLLCSDGLALDDAAIRSILRRHGHPQQAADQLVHEALLAGSRDNIGCVVVRVVH